MKSEYFDKLIDSMSKCNACLKLGDKSLINFYDNEMAKNIPSIWTDWYNHLDSDIMIIGQDWGPYLDMKELYEKLCMGEDYKSLIDSEKSLTKKKLYNFLSSSANNYRIKVNDYDVFITNAIMCARTGKCYRGNNIDLKHSTLACSKYLASQIEIVKPKVILTLGYYPLLSLSKIFDFKIDTNLTKTIEKYDIIDLGEMIIIPTYHPTAQISNERQMLRYNKIWEYLKGIRK